MITSDEEQFGASRKDARLALEAKNIESRLGCKPVHLGPVFADWKMYGENVYKASFKQGNASQAALIILRKSKISRSL